MILRIFSIFTVFFLAVSYMVPTARAQHIDQKTQHTIDLVNHYAREYEITKTLDFQFVNLPQDARSSGNAEMEWGPNLCRVRIDPSKAKEFWGGPLYFEESLSFVALHEFGHCVFYQNQHLDWMKAGYTGSVPERMIDEYLLSDAIVDHIDRVGFLALAHEAYADAFAIQALRKEGVSWQTLDKIRVLREDSIFDKVHATADVFHLLHRGHYEHLDPAQAARLVAAQFMLNNEDFSFVLRFMTKSNSSMYVANNWCILAMTETKYPVEHPMLGKVGNTKDFYPTFQAPQFMKTQFDLGRVHWKETCHQELTSFFDGKL